MKIAIAGTGYLGIPSAIYLAQNIEEVALGAIAAKRGTSPLLFLPTPSLRGAQRRGKPVAPNRRHCERSAAIQPIKHRRSRLH